MSFQSSGRMTPSHTFLFLLFSAVSTVAMPSPQSREFGVVRSSSVWHREMSSHPFSVNSEILQCHLARIFTNPEGSCTTLFTLLRQEKVHPDKSSVSNHFEKWLTLMNDKLCIIVMWRKKFYCVEKKYFPKHRSHLEQLDQGKTNLHRSHTSWCWLSMESSEVGQVDYPYIVIKVSD